MHLIYIFGKEYTDLNGIQQLIVNGTVLPLILGGGAIETIGGGWYGCIWESESIYKFSLLLTGSLAYPDLGLTKTAWNNIMNKRNEVINELGEKGKMFSVYFNTGYGGSPEYGLSRIASDFTYAKKANEGGLEEVYSQIASAIVNEHKTTEPHTNVVEVELTKVTKITEIRIEGNPIPTADVEYIKNNLKDYNSTTDTGILNLNDFPTIFRVAGKNIDIIY